MSNINFWGSSQFNANIGTSSIKMIGNFCTKLKIPKSETFSIYAYVDDGVKNIDKSGNKN